MKRFVLVLIALFTLSITNAQDISVGLKAGINYGATKTSDADYNKHFDPIITPHFGVVVDIALNDSFSIQPELMYSTSGFKRSESIDLGEYSLKYDIKGALNYLSIPIMAKYAVAEGFNLEVGPNIGLLLGTKVTGTVESPAGTQTLDDDDETQEGFKESFKSTDLGLALGASYEMESGLFVSLRYNLGLTDINDEDLSAIEVAEGVLDKDDTVKNNIFQFSIGYKFM